MTKLNKTVIFWDFDGVIMDSMQIRNRGFAIVLQQFPKFQVDQLMQYHLENGGLSRYVKFRHFFEKIRATKISEGEVQEWADKFSVLMRKELLSADLLIRDSLDFIRRNPNNSIMHIVSGSDQEELRFICERLGISTLFKSIHGSPTPKNELVRELIDFHNYDVKECILIGDSVNDYDAALNNHIEFHAYNNPKLKNLKVSYIENFSNYEN